MASVIHATLTQVRQIAGKLNSVGLAAVFAELKAVRLTFSLTLFPVCLSPLSLSPTDFLYMRVLICG